MGVVGTDLLLLLRKEFFLVDVILCFFSFDVNISYRFFLGRDIFLSGSLHTGKVFDSTFVLIFLILPSVKFKFCLVEGGV